MAGNCHTLNNGGEEGHASGGGGAEAGRTSGCTKDGDEVEFGNRVSRYMSYRPVFAGYSSIADCGSKDIFPGMGFVAMLHHAVSWDASLAA